MNTAVAHALLAYVSVTMLLFCGCGGPEPAQSPRSGQPTRDTPTADEPRPKFLREIDWAARGTWVKIDTHLHTRFSDGAHTVAEVAHKAVEHGCHAIAITDHADANLRAASPEYAAAIRAARDKFPQLVILAGLEWNLPPYGGREHVTLLVPQDEDEWKILTGFKARFDHLDDQKRASDSPPASPPPQATDALAWLESMYEGQPIKPVLLFNHPSRKRETAATLIEDLRYLREASGLVVGFSGAPGHQGFAADRLGAYEGKLQTIDRWDPAVATVGGAWDDMLAAGDDAWAARAASDLHRAVPGQDYWPGEFSETWAYAPDRSADGVLRAIHAGSFFGVHGHIARNVALTLETDGLARMAMPGETVEIPTGSTVTAKLRMRVPPRDWQGQPNHVDQVELIAIDEDAAITFAKGPPTAEGPAITHTFPVPAGGIVLRARGRRMVADGPDLMFYTNPIRVVASRSE